MVFLGELCECKCTLVRVKAFFYNGLAGVPLNKDVNETR